MARRRWQSGTIVVEGDKIKHFKIRYIEYLINENGCEVRKRRKVDLGLVSEIGTERAARRAAQPLLAEINANAGRPKHLITLLGVCKKYKELIIPKHKKSTKQSELSHLKIIERDFGHLPIAEVGVEMLERWVSQNTQYKPKTLRNITTTFRCIWKDARKWGYIDENRRDPFEDVDMPKRGLVNRPVYTPEQVRLILEKAEEPLRTICWIAVQTGLRGGELVALSIEDLDLENNLVHVRKSAFEGELQPPKTGNAVRTFKISQQLSDHLRVLISTRRGLVFTTSTGNAYRNGELVARKLKPLLIGLGINQFGLGFHGFRRASASAMDALSTPMKVRQERLGHASAEMTMGYTSSNSQDHHVVAEALGKMFDPVQKTDTPASPEPEWALAQGAD